MHPSQKPTTRQIARAAIWYSWTFCLTIWIVAAACLAQPRNGDAPVPSPALAFFNAERERVPAFVRDIEADLGDSLVNPVPELTGWARFKDPGDADRDVWVVAYRVGYLSGNGSVPAVRAAIVDDHGQLVARYPDLRTAEHVHVVATPGTGPGLVGFVSRPGRAHSAMLSVWTVEKEPRKLYQFGPTSGFAPHVFLRITFADLNGNGWPDALIERECRDFKAGQAWREYQFSRFDAEAEAWAYPQSLTAKDYRLKLAQADRGAARTVIDVYGPPYETSVEDRLIWKAE